MKCRDCKEFESGTDQYWARYEHGDGEENNDDPQICKLGAKDFPEDDLYMEINDCANDCPLKERKEKEETYKRKNAVFPGCYGCPNYGEHLAGDYDDGPIPYCKGNTILEDGKTVTGGYADDCLRFTKDGNSK